MKMNLAIPRRLALLWIAVACALGDGSLTSPAPTSLIPWNDTWRYLATPADQGSAWRATGFDDSAWPQGAARLGFGDTQATNIGYGGDSNNKYTTTYFRKTFPVIDPASFVALELRLTQDDGAIVYLNGTEVVRTNMPSGPVSYSTFASSAVGSANEYAFCLHPASLALLVPGTNVIAAEVHQINPTSSDLGFDMELTGLHTASVSRGPYLQLGSPTSVVVRWRTNAGTDSRVLYGDSPSTLTSSFTNPTATTGHELTLTGLTPDTRYFYAVGSTTQIFEGADADTFFDTPPIAGTEKPVRVWVLGDPGTQTIGQRNVRDAYQNFTGSTHTDLWLMLGDNAYSDGTDDEYQAALFDVYGSMLRKSVVWPALGNHDTAQNSDFGGSYPYFDIFTLPVAGEAGGAASGTEHYYSFDYANIHFVCLDSQTANRSVGGAMHGWLTTDLEQTSQKWIVAFWHHPPYTKASHDSDTTQQSIEMRENFLPLLEDHGVDLVLCGHTHNYQRSPLIDGFYATPTLSTSGSVKDSGSGDPNGDGVYGKDYGGHNGAVYAVAGSSGKVSGSTVNHPVMFTLIRELGSMVLDVNGNRLDAKFINDSGVMRDAFTIIKGPLVTITVDSADAAEWGTQPGALTLTRTGPVDDALAVVLNIAGGVTNGADCETIPASVTIPAAANSVAVSVQPIADDLVEGPEDIALTITPSGSYRLGLPIAGTVTIADRPMNQWFFENFTSVERQQSAISGILADPDGDGQTNLEEYIYALEPKVADRPARTISLEGDRLTMVYTRRKSATDVTIVPQVSGSLQPPWDSGPAFIDEFPPVDLGDGNESVTIQDKTASAIRRFMRLQFESP